MLATNLQEPVTITYGDIIIITIGDTTVSVNYDITTTGKYKGLDLFSTSGIPLTTREQIKARRAELQLKY
jgi:predicted ThiF/HesA family dinucleotide-utilizing enzyme